MDNIVACNSVRLASAGTRVRRPSSQTSSPGRLRARIAALAAAALLCASLPHAASASQTETPSAVADGAVQALVAREIGPDRRIEVTVGRLDPRLQLAPCDRVEPFLPRGARLWGRSSIGVRCVSGAGWSVLLPVHVRVFGQALVANAALPAGRAPDPSDFRSEEVDLTRLHGPLVADARELHDKVLARPLAAGQPLRQDALKVPAVFAAGDPVRIVVQGDGFTIVGAGVAMSPAAEGQRLRVRTESGRVVVGLVRDRSVEIRL
jgi:flagella basal body P-ring formation protein FlgA